jgi:hypothetical protein
MKRKLQKPEFVMFAKLYSAIRKAKKLCRRGDCPEKAVSQNLCALHLREKSQGKVKSRKKMLN